MDRISLFDQIKRKQSYLCIGLDTDIERIPSFLLREADPIYEFNKRIIEATHQYCVAYKPNIAFYEAMGPSGWESLQKTLDFIPADIFTIADAKRGDIGNTSALYAKAFFETMDFDSVTVAPYMGHDSVSPFFNHKGKWVILLAHTSNSGSEDFQLIESKGAGRRLYEEVILKSQTWAGPDQMMYVVGATQPDKIEHIRSLAPDYFFLVPGVGAQGGDLSLVSQYGMNKQCGLLVNSSRGIIYASNNENFTQVASQKAQEMQQQMESLLSQYL